MYSHITVETAIPIAPYPLITENVSPMIFKTVYTILMFITCLFLFITFK